MTRLTTLRLTDSRLLSTTLLIGIYGKEKARKEKTTLTAETNWTGTCTWIAVLRPRDMRMDARLPVLRQYP
ncbi:hypothetical protein SLA2020_321230 [Shorea laevis]